MEGVTIALVVVIVLAVAFDYINGFHDTANAIATSVATRALHPERIAEWDERWGTSATPLLWSHAMYLTLAHGLGLPRS